MLDGILQWLAQNVSWLYPLAALVTILTGIEILFKPLRWAIPKLYSFLSRPFKAANRSRIVLRFVAKRSSCYWGMGSQGDLLITTNWYVTHVPGSGSQVPVRLLKTCLLEPLAKYFVGGLIVMESDEYALTSLEGVIPEGQTRDITIRCGLSKVLNSEKPIKVRLAVEDQFANKHKLPLVVVKPTPTGKN